jgi:hypothetical protein
VETFQPFYAAAKSANGEHGQQIDGDHQSSGTVGHGISGLKFLFWEKRLMK